MVGILPRVQFRSVDFGMGVFLQGCVPLEKCPQALFLGSLLMTPGSPCQERESKQRLTSSSQKVSVEMWTFLLLSRTVRDPTKCTALPPHSFSMHITAIGMVLARSRPEAGFWQHVSGLVLLGSLCSSMQMTQVRILARPIACCAQTLPPQLAPPALVSGHHFPLIIIHREVLMMEICLIRQQN